MLILNDNLLRLSGKMVIHTMDIREDEAGERVDTFLSGKTGITRSQIQKRIEKGDVLVNGGTVSQNYKIKPGDRISVADIPEKVAGLIPEDIPLTSSIKMTLLLLSINLRAWSYIRLRVTVRGH